MVSIIIPCRTIKEAEFCINQCLKLEYDFYEIIVIPDKYDTDYCIDNSVPDHVFIRIVDSGNILPSHKRDLGIMESNGDILAFIDADAFPHQLWLKAATDILESDDEIAGVCGAGVLPENSTEMEQVADDVMKLMPFNYRIDHSAERYVNDYPTFNLIFKKKYVDEVGGFNCDYLTGEDTLLCQKITIGLGKKILYHPLLFVYHSRRGLFMPFIKQVMTYGKHRGFFFKRYPETSRKMVYLIPLMGVICVGFFLLYVVWLFLQ